MAWVSKAQYRAIKNSLSATEREIIKYYEICWHMGQKVPTTTEVVEYINKKFAKEKKTYRLKHTALNYYLGRHLFVKALEDRGIPFRQHSQAELTPEQLAAALTVCNFADERSTATKLDELGITSAQYYAWLEDPVFKNFVEMKSESNLKNIRPAAINEFTKKINSGDWNAIKYYLEVTGAAAANDAPQSETLLRVLIEILQEEIKDPATLARIASRIKAATQNRTIEYVEDPPQAITAQPYVIEEDQELMDARKKLGI